MIAFTFKKDIEAYLRSLRCFDQSPTLGADEDELQALIGAHNVTVKEGATDSLFGGGIPLANVFSWIQDLEQLARISEVYLDFEALDEGTRALYWRVIEGANLSSTPGQELAGSAPAN
jgi:hypothetical protein